MKCSIRFIDESVRDTFYKLEHSTSEDKKLYQAIRRTFVRIENNGESGILIKKKQIPKRYLIKYKLTSLWKYNLPGYWRLLYTIANDENGDRIAVIIKWMTHEQYDKEGF